MNRKRWHWNMCCWKNGISIQKVVTQKVQYSEITLKFTDLIYSIEFQSLLLNFNFITFNHSPSTTLSLPFIPKQHVGVVSRGAWSALGSAEQRRVDVAALSQSGRWAGDPCVPARHRWGEPVKPVEKSSVCCLLDHRKESLCCCWWDTNLCSYRFISSTGNKNKKGKWSNEMKLVVEILPFSVWFGSGRFSHGVCLVGLPLTTHFIVKWIVGKAPQQWWAALQQESHSVELHVSLFLFGSGWSDVLWHPDSRLLGGLFPPGWEDDDAGVSRGWDFFCHDLLSLIRPLVRFRWGHLP